MNWVNKCKLPAIEVLQFNGQPCIKISSLWQVLYQIFNSAQSCQINSSLLSKFPSKQTWEWPLLSNEEFRSTIAKYNSSSTPRLDHVLWWYLKAVIKDDKYLANIINIANACINLGHWPYHFKTSLSIITSKPNKIAYNSSKIFHPIILLNTGKTNWKGYLWKTSIPINFNKLHTYKSIRRAETMFNYRCRSFSYLFYLLRMD